MEMLCWQFLLLYRFLIFKNQLACVLLILIQPQDLQFLESPLLEWPIKPAQAAIPCAVENLQPFPGFLRGCKRFRALLLTSEPGSL